MELVYVLCVAVVILSFGMFCLSDKYDIPEDEGELEIPPVNEWVRMKGEKKND